jgi:hypothetical protein
VRKHRSVFVIYILDFELNSDAIKKLQGNNKELLIISGVVYRICTARWMHFTLIK